MLRGEREIWSQRKFLKICESTDVLEKYQKGDRKRDQRKEFTSSRGLSEAQGHKRNKR